MPFHIPIPLMLDTCVYRYDKNDELYIVNFIPLYICALEIRSQFNAILNKNTINIKVYYFTPIAPFSA